MSERAKAGLHNWVNSVVAVLALCIAGVSTYFSWIAERRNEESVLFESVPTGACELQYIRVDDTAVVGLCWKVTMSNSSDVALSIISYRVFGAVDAGGPIAVGGGRLRSMESLGGAPIQLPLILQGGESKQVVVRAPAFVPKSVADILFADDHAKQLRTVGELQRELAKSHLGVLGNTVDPISDGDVMIGWSLQPTHSMEGLFRVRTGRGSAFGAILSWPPRPN